SSPARIGSCASCVSGTPTSKSSSSTGATSSAWPSISTSTSQAESGRRPPDERIGEIHLSAPEIALRVRELGAEIARHFDGREPVLVASLKASLVFCADLSRAIPIFHALDFVELAGYGSAVMGGHQQIRVLKDLDLDVRGRDVLIVEDVVDTGLTLNYLVRT